MLGVESLTTTTITMTKTQRLQLQMRLERAIQHLERTVRQLPEYRVERMDLQGFFAQYVLAMAIEEQLRNQEMSLLPLLERVLEVASGAERVRDLPGPCGL